MRQEENADERMQRRCAATPSKRAVGPSNPDPLKEHTENWGLGGPTHRVMALSRVTWFPLIGELPFGTRFGHVAHAKDNIMNSIVYLVGRSEEHTSELQSLRH